MVEGRRLPAAHAVTVLAGGREPEVVRSAGAREVPLVTRDTLALRAGEDQLGVTRDAGGLGVRTGRPEAGVRAGKSAAGAAASRRRACGNCHSPPSTCRADWRTTSARRWIRRQTGRAAREPAIRFESWRRTLRPAPRLRCVMPHKTPRFTNFRTSLDVDVPGLEQRNSHNRLRQTGGANGTPPGANSRSVE